MPNVRPHRFSFFKLKFINFTILHNRCITRHDGIIYLFNFFSPLPICHLLHVLSYLLQYHLTPVSRLHLTHPLCSQLFLIIVSPFSSTCPQHGPQETATYIFDLFLTRLYPGVNVGRGTRRLGPPIPLTALKKCFL